MKKQAKKHLHITLHTLHESLKKYLHIKKLFKRHVTGEKSQNVSRGKRQWGFCVCFHFSLFICIFSHVVSCYSFVAFSSLAEKKQTFRNIHKSISKQNACLWKNCCFVFIFVFNILFPTFQPLKNMTV